MKSNFLADFKAFAMKGNAIDMAIGVVIGAAFGKIVSSLVSDIIMPLIGKLIGGIDFGSLKLLLSAATIGPDGKEVAPVYLTYGVFIQNTVDFFIISFSIFFCVWGVGKLARKKAEAPPVAPPAPREEVVLLTEICNLLKAREGSIAPEDAKSIRDTLNASAKDAEVNKNNASSSSRDD